MLRILKLTWTTGRRDASHLPALQPHTMAISRLHSSWNDDPLDVLPLTQKNTMVLRLCLNLHCLCRVHHITILRRIRHASSHSRRYRSPEGSHCRDLLHFFAWNYHLLYSRGDVCRRKSSPDLPVPSDLCSFPLSSRCYSSSLQHDVPAWAKRVGCQITARPLTIPFVERGSPRYTSVQPAETDIQSADTRSTQLAAPAHTFPLEVQQPMLPFR